MHLWTVARFCFEEFSPGRSQFDIETIKLRPHYGFPLQFPFIPIQSQLNIHILHESDSYAIIYTSNAALLYSLVFSYLPIGRDRFISQFQIKESVFCKLPQEKPNLRPTQPSLHLRVAVIKDAFIWPSSPLRILLHNFCFPYPNARLLGASLCQINIESFRRSASSLASTGVMCPLLTNNKGFRQNMVLYYFK